MRTIKILITATEELHDEKIQFQTLIEQLNCALGPRGIEIERIKWDPNKDGAIENFKTKMSKCEMCLSLYWRELAKSSEAELKAAYESLKGGQNPKNLYIFFKEPSNEISDALRDFKANFVTEYGHFFCKFENVDTMNLQFILQFETMQNRLPDEQNKLITVSDGKVKVGDEPLVNLDNVPFAALNKDYQRLQKELVELDRQISDTRKALKANPDNEDLEDELMMLRSKRKKLADEFKKYQTHLYDIALGFAKRTGEAMSERMIRAREEFEKGNVIEADRILNMEDMKREAEQEMKQFEQHRKNLELSIEEFLLKSETVMANVELTLSERFDIARDAYEQALSLSKSIKVDSALIAKILQDYGRLMQFFNQMEDAISLDNEALCIYRKLAETNPHEYLCCVADILNNLSILQKTLHQFDKAEKSVLESLAIRRQLAEEDPDIYLPKVAASLNNLGGLQLHLHCFIDAEKSFLEALDVLKKLSSKKSADYMPYLAMTFHNMAVLQEDLNKFSEAESNYQEALEIRAQLADKEPDLYLADMVDTLTNLANLQRRLRHYDEAEASFCEALPYRRIMAKESPEMNMPALVLTLHGMALLQEDIDQYNEAEKNYTEALNIQRKLAELNPNAHIGRLAVLLENVATLYGRQDRYNEAEEKLVEATDILRKLKDAYPEAYLAQYAHTLYNLANLQRLLHKYEESERKHFEVLEIQDKLVKEHQDVFWPDIAFTINNIAAIQADMGRYEEAEKSYLKALEIRRSLAEEYPEVYLRHYGYTLNGLINVQKALRKDDDVEENTKELMSIYYQISYEDSSRN